MQKFAKLGSETGGGEGTGEGAKQRGVFVDARGDTGQRIDSFLIGDNRNGGLRRGLRFRFMIRQLVNGDDLAIMREKHLAVDEGWDDRHGIGVTTPQKDVVVERGIDNFNVDTDSLTGKGDREVWKKTNGLGGMAIPRTEGDGGRGQLR